jgi:hypothetical protein
MTALDAMTAVNVLKRSIPIPYPLHLTPYHNFPDSLKLLSFKVRIYSPNEAAHNAPTPGTNQQLFGMNGLVICTDNLENSLLESAVSFNERASDFEKYVDMSVELIAIRSWADLAEAYAAVAVKQAPNWSICPQTIKSLKRLQFVIGLMPVIVERRRFLDQYFQDLELHWGTFIGDIGKSDVVKGQRQNMSKIQIGVLAEATMELKSLPYAELHRQFEVLCGVLQKIRLIAPSMCFVTFVAAMAKSIVFPVAFLLFSGIVVKSPEFEGLSDDGEMAMWAKCESFLVYSICGSAEYSDLQAAFLEIQSALT